MGNYYLAIAKTTKSPSPQQNVEKRRSGVSR